MSEDWLQTDVVERRLCAIFFLRLRCFCEARPGLSIHVLLRKTKLDLWPFNRANRPAPAPGTCSTSLSEAGRSAPRAD